MTNKRQCLQNIRKQANTAQNQFYAVKSNKELAHGKSLETDIFSLCPWGYLGVNAQNPAF